MKLFSSYCRKIIVHYSKMMTNVIDELTFKVVQFALLQWIS